MSMNYVEKDKLQKILSNKKELKDDIKPHDWSEMMKILEYDVKKAEWDFNKYKDYIEVLKTELKEKNN